MKELENKVVSWATERGIYNGEVDFTRYNTQLFKLISEVGELCDAYIKKDKELIKDAIGDCLVVITSMVRLCKPRSSLVGLVEDYTKVNSLTTDSALKYIVELCGSLCNEIDNEARNLMLLSNIVNFLDNIAEYELNNTLLSCYESAYNVIKNRKGKTTAEGNFIKE